MTDDELDLAIENRQNAAALRDAMQKEVDTYSDQLRGALSERGQERVERDAWVVQIVPQDRKTLNTKKLLSVGVTTVQIEMATEVTHIEQLRVTKRSVS